MDCNFTTIKTCELKDSTFRSRILDFGDFDISDYTFSAVYKTGFDQVISEQELTAIGNILTVPLEAMEGVSNRAKAEVWMLRDGGFKDKVIVFDVVISATGCPSDASITDGVSVTFGGLKVPVTVTQAVYMNVTDEQLDAIAQPAIEAATLATTAATNADTAAGLATDATVEAVNATGQAIAATAQAENAAENADEAAVEALAAKDAANAAAANNMMRYNDSAETVATDVIRRVDKGTKLEQEYKETTKNIDGVNMTDAMVDGVTYIKRGNKYYINSDFAINRSVYLESYGLPGDGVLRSIATLFPNVTLEQVQALNPAATLANSADWYILMKLNRDLPINSTVYLTGGYIIDEELTWRRSSITWEAHPYKRSSKYPSDKNPYIKQITPEKNVIAFRDGDGLTNYYEKRIENVTLKGFDIIGVMAAVGKTGHGILVDIPNADMIHCKFLKVSCYRNGKSGFYHESGHVNDVIFDYFSAVLNFDTGIWLNGKPSSQTNFFNFRFCSVSSNGYVIRNGELAEYNYTLDGIDYTKGGASFGNLTAVHWDTCNNQSNNGFGLMTRDFASIRGLDISGGYSEMNPLGDYVMFCQLESNVIMNTNSQSEVYYEGDTLPPLGHFSVFKTREHARKFIPSNGIAYNKELHKRIWSGNIIPDAVNNVPDASGGGVTMATSRDSDGYLIRTYTKLKVNPDATQIYFTDISGASKLLGLKRGDLVNLSFDMKFNDIEAADYASLGFLEIGILTWTPYATLRSLPVKPSENGAWVRVNYHYEVTGLESQTGSAKYPFLRFGYNSLQGTQMVFSIRKASVKIKTSNNFFQEPTPNATTLLKGVVNQAAAVANVATADATDLATALTLVNELKAKLNAKLGADRTAGQQAT